MINIVALLKMNFDFFFYRAFNNKTTELASFNLTLFYRYFVPYAVYKGFILLIFP